MIKKGFSLIEVMIAVVILGVALIPMMNMLGMGTKGYVKTQHTVQAYNLAVEGLEWMKSLDFNHYYWQKFKDSEEGYWIMSHSSYSANAEMDGELAQPIMWVYNIHKNGAAETDPDKKGALADFKAYYPYVNGGTVETQEVIIAYKSDYYRRKGMSEFKRYGYFEMLDNNSALITCVVKWSEEKFLTGNRERYEKISTVVVNNANVQH